MASMDDALSRRHRRIARLRLAAFALAGAGLALFVAGDVHAQGRAVRHDRVGSALAWRVTPRCGSRRSARSSSTPTTRRSGWSCGSTSCAWMRPSGSLATRACSDSLEDDIADDARQGAAAGRVARSRGRRHRGLVWRRSRRRRDFDPSCSAARPVRRWSRSWASRRRCPSTPKPSASPSTRGC